MVFGDELLADKQDRHKDTFLLRSGKRQNSPVHRRDLAGPTS